MLLDSQLHIWWISIHSHEAKAFRLRRVIQNCPGICNMLAYIRSVQVKLSITEKEKATEAFAVLQPWTAVGHAEQTWFNDSLEARWPSVGLVCKDLNCKNWVRPVEQKPTRSKKLENDPCEDLCFNLTIRMDRKNLLSRLPAAQLLLLGFGPDCSKQYNHGTAAKGHRGYFMSLTLGRRKFHCIHKICQSGIFFCQCFQIWLLSMVDFLS